MVSDEVVLNAIIKLLESDNFLLKQKLNEKNKEIKILEKKIRLLTMKVPKKITEIQLSLDEFI